MCRVWIPSGTVRGILGNHLSRRQQIGGSGAGLRGWLLSRLCDGRGGCDIAAHLVPPLTLRQRSNRCDRCQTPKGTGPALAILGRYAALRSGRCPPGSSRGRARRFARACQCDVREASEAHVAALLSDPNAQHPATTAARQHLERQTRHTAHEVKAGRCETTDGYRAEFGCFLWHHRANGLLAPPSTHQRI